MPNKKPCLNFIRQVLKIEDAGAILYQSWRKKLITSNLSTKRLIEQNRNVKIIPKGAGHCLSCPCDLQPQYNSLYEFQDITICQLSKLWSHPLEITEPVSQWWSFQNMTVISFLNNKMVLWFGTSCFRCKTNNPIKLEIVRYCRY